MRELLIECGVAQTRGALVIGGVVRRFFFLPAFEDPIDPASIEPGDILLGRVKSVSGAIGGAFVNIGVDQDGFLPIKDMRAAPPEGAAIIVRVHRPVFAQKGAVLAGDWGRGLSSEERVSFEAKAEKAKPPQRLREPENVLIRLMQIISDPVESISVDHALGAATLRKRYSSVDVNIETAPFADQDIEAQIEMSLQASISLPGGGRLIFAETEGGCVIDVDAASAAGGSSLSVNDKVNESAATMIINEISRRSIGGRIIVDFLPPASAKSQSALFEMMKKSLRALPGARAGKLHKDGLFDLTLPRTQVSLLAQASEASGEAWVRPGRRLTADWCAKQALHRLEAILRRSPRARPSLRLGGDLMACVARNVAWESRLADRYGARFLIEPSDQVQPRAYDIAE